MTKPNPANEQQRAAAAARDGATARVLLARGGLSGRQAQVVETRAAHPEWSWPQIAAACGMPGRHEARGAFRQAARTAGLSGTVPCKCGQQCGDMAEAEGYGYRCYRRWLKAGRPASGPPPKTTPQEVGRRSAATKRARALAEVDEPDAYDLAWEAAAPLRAEAAMAARVQRARLLAGALIRCVAASDAAGVDRVLSKAADWPALAVVLAECASPARAAVVAGQPAAASVPAVPERDGEQAVAGERTGALRAVREDDAA